MSARPTSPAKPAPEAAAQGKRRGLLSGIHARLQGRPDTEHGQALVRLIVGSIFFVYMLPKALTDPDGAQQGVDQMFLAAMLVYLLASTAVFAGIVISPGVSPVRRVLGALVDTAAITFFMSATDSYGAPLFLVYLWCTLGNGFRYGAKYLIISLAMNITGFGVVLVVSPFWKQYFGAGVGMMIGMAALSLYALSLVNRLYDALARAESANQAKRRFISVVSHEMRTPLNALIGMNELLRDSTLNREQAEMVNTMGSASRVLLGLVEDVLDFSKIEAGKLTIEDTEFDLHAVVNSTCKLLTSQAEAKGLELLISIMPEVPPALRGDPHHIRQILINLVGNALKFTEKGSVTVHVSLLSESEQAVRVKFSVRDTGIGITPEAQARIFESFVQEDQTTTRRFGGTGLGTTIAKQLVELMGGRMGLESAVGLGSTFWFEVELIKQPETADGPLFDGEAADSRVLVVGFGADDREFLLQTLRGWGVTTVFAANAVEGGQKIIAEAGLARPYKSVLVIGHTLDDARHSLAALRRGQPNSPPIVLCTQATGPEGAAQRLAAISAGFAAALEFPIQKRLLFNVLHSVTAVEDSSVGGGVVQLRDYLKKREGARRYRIVVADDSATNRQVIGKILERGGHSVTLVDDGEFVLDALETAEFDMAILDRNMPGMGGVETLRALRAMGYRRDSFPVVILSADVTGDTRVECDEAGANAFLPKPVEAARLLESVAELCGHSREERAGQGADAVRPIQPAMQPGANGRDAAAVAGPLNMGTIRLLEGLGTQSGFLERLIKVFVGDNRQLLEKMERSVSSKDFGEFRRLLHAMKGSAASIGAEQLAMSCTAMNGLTDSEMSFQQKQLTEGIKTEFERAEAALDRYLEEKRRTTG